MTYERYKMITIQGPRFPLPVPYILLIGIKTLISYQIIFCHGFLLKRSMYLISLESIFRNLIFWLSNVTHNFRPKSSRSFRRLLNLTIFNISCQFKFLLFIIPFVMFNHSVPSEAYRLGDMLLVPYKNEQLSQCYKKKNIGKIVAEFLSPKICIT